MDLTAATKATLDRTVEMEKRLSEMELQRKELLYRFTPSHPAIRAVDEKVAQLKAERESLNEQIRQLPEAESASLRLMRDVKVANELYVTLLNKAQELKVMKSGLVGNAHVLDLAVRPETPVSPNKTRSAAIAIAAGLLLGVVLAFARKALRQGLVDPADAERATGLPVRASVPHSDRQAALQREAKGGGNLPVLAAVDPTDMAAESLRALRTSLQFALMESSNHIIAIGGPRPGVGKSFVTMNLARVFADTGKRVLLLDADLRKGSCTTTWASTGRPASPRPSPATCPSPTCSTRPRCPASTSCPAGRRRRTRRSSWAASASATWWRTWPGATTSCSWTCRPSWR